MSRIATGSDEADKPIRTERNPEELRLQDQLINHRLSWLGTFCGFLVAAVALSLNNKRPDVGAWICVFGGFTAVSTFFGTLAANLVLWETAKAEKWPRQWMFWLMPGFFFPLIAVVWWIVLAIALFKW